MMTQQLGFSILTAPVAAIDRRALSQAWYSALHLARPARTASSKSTRASMPAPDVRPALARAPGMAQRPLLSRAVATAAPGPRESRGENAIERRTVRSPLARRIERAFLHPRLRVHQATFAVDGTKARVHIALQSSGGGMHLVAICSPQVRSRVAGALDQARFALAARGIQLSLDFSASC